MISDYNPNIEWGKQRVEIVLMQWAYKATFTLDEEDVWLQRMVVSAQIVAWTPPTPGQ
jgi:hypothetical protein